MTLLDSAFHALRPLSFRGKVRITEPFCRRNRVVTATVFGYSIKLDLSNYMDRMVYLGCYEPLNTYLFKKILRPGMTVIDVGANIGYFSLLSAKIVGKSGRVFSIEPHPENFSLLRDTIETNKISQIQPHQMGFGDRAEEVPIGMADPLLYPNRTASTLHAKATDPITRIETLDSFAAREKLVAIDLLKIDVDGYESRILKGAAESFRNGCIKNLLIELNPHWLKESGTSAEAIKKILSEYGFNDLTDHYPCAAFILGRTDDRYFALCRAKKTRKRQ